MTFCLTSKMASDSELKRILAARNTKLKKKLQGSDFFQCSKHQHAPTMEYIFPKEQSCSVLLQTTGRTDRHRPVTPRHALPTQNPTPSRSPSPRYETAAPMERHSRYSTQLHPRQAHPASRHLPALRHHPPTLLPVHSHLF